MRHQANIDVAFVIAVNQHNVVVLASEHLLVETNEGRSIFGFDNANDFGIDIGSFGLWHQRAKK